MLNNGCDVAGGGEGHGEAADGEHANDAAHPSSSSPSSSSASSSPSSCAFMRYLRDVGFVGKRPHLLLQPLVPLLAQHYEIKIYFLEREPFYASLVYGKEKLMARVVRPSTDAALFDYLAPLLDESRRALDALPPDGPHDPKILMRVDWGTGEPLLPARADRAEEGGADADGAADADAAGAAESGGGSDGGAFLKRALVKRAGSLAAPQKKLKRSMDAHRHAPLTGASRHFINEIEIHPGYYVDWDDTPDETIAPLADAYGRYLTRVLGERQHAAAAAAAAP